MLKFFKSPIFIYAISLALLLVCLRFVEFRFLVLEHAQDTYIAIIAVLFTAVGIWAGIKLTGKKPEIIEKKIPVVIEQQDFDPGMFEHKLEEFNISKREYEVLLLIAKGHSNQEIAEKLFVSLSSVKTYTARLFSKLDVERRTQAVQKAKAMGLLP